MTKSKERQYLDNHSISQTYRMKRGTISDTDYQNFDIAEFLIKICIGTPEGLSMEQLENLVKLSDMTYYTRPQMEVLLWYAMRCQDYLRHNSTRKFINI